MIKHPLEGKCKLHGKQILGFSKTMGGWFCTACAKAGYVKDHIAKEIAASAALGLKKD